MTLTLTSKKVLVVLLPLSGVGEINVALIEEPKITTCAPVRGERTFHPTKPRADNCNRNNPITTMLTKLTHLLFFGIR